MIPCYPFLASRSERFTEASVNALTTFPKSSPSTISHYLVSIEAVRISVAMVVVIHAFLR